MKRVSSATPGHPKVSREATRKCFLGLVNTWRGTQASWQQSMHPFVSWQRIKQHFCLVQNMTMHSEQSNEKYRPWVCWDTSTLGQIQPFRPMHSRKNAGRCLLTKRAANMLRFKGTWLNRITAILKEKHWGVEWELENFHHFIYGKHYFLHTDH